jgi:hypothetical protein
MGQIVKNLLIMNLTVTLDLPEEAAALAKRAAIRRHSTISEVVRSYLMTIANEEAGTVPMEDKQNLTLSEKIAAVRNSRGILPLPPNFVLKDFIAEQKAKDYAGS